MDSYYNYLQTPWGQLFYRLLWTQMDIFLPTNQSLKILDYGSGFGKTASHLAEGHQVIAYEPNEKMLEMTFRKYDYQQFTGSEAAFFETIADEKFDLILLHNVLEYITDRESLLQKLTLHLKKDGCFSIVKHNQLGEVFAQSIFFDAPDKALNLLEQSSGESVNFGQFQFYTNKWLESVLSPLQLQKLFGLRITYGLSQNNEIKTDPAWQDQMFELEMTLAENEAVREVAFFQHLLFSAPKSNDTY